MFASFNDSHFERNLKRERIVKAASHLLYRFIFCQDLWPPEHNSQPFVTDRKSSLEIQHIRLGSIGGESNCIGQLSADSMEWWDDWGTFFQVFGALINGVWLLTMCFTIALESIGRIINPRPIGHPSQVRMIGGIEVQWIRGRREDK